MDIALNTLREVANALTEPYLVSVLLLLTLLLYKQNKKTTIMQKMIIGENIDSAFELTISQVVMGIFAGALASVICSYLGIVFDENSSVDLMFFFSIVLMMLSPRLVCFSYSGAVLGFISLILNQLSLIYKNTVVNLFGYSINMSNIDILQIDIVAIMSLIAILHFVEGLLVIFDGKRGAIPVFTNKENKIIGGFAMKRYWAVPIALLVLTQDKSIAYLDKAVTVPNAAWWPLVKLSLPFALFSAGIIIPIALYGVLGYNAVTFTRTKSEKTLSSGLGIIIYSVVLLMVAQIAHYGLIGQLFVLIFAPGAHEIMIRIQKTIENKGKPRYISNGEGLMILEVAPNSPAKEMGIKSGDELLEINNQFINDENALQTALSEASHYLWVKIKRLKGEIVDLNYNAYNSTKRLGVVFVPKNIPADSMVVKLDGTRFQEVLNKLKNRDKNKDNDINTPEDVRNIIDESLKSMEQEKEHMTNTVEHDTKDKQEGSEENKETSEHEENK